MTGEQGAFQAPSAEVLTTRGLAHHNMRRYDKALADFSRAIKLDPGYALAFASRGETYLKLKRYDEALADLSRALDLRLTARVEAQGQGPGGPQPG